MDVTRADQYFELAQDLPADDREALLLRLDREAPKVGRVVRSLLAGISNPDFLTRRDSAGERVLDHLHHVAIPVEDIAAAARWYRQRFGCEVEYVDASWAMLRFANLRIALVKPEQHPGHFAVSRRDAAVFGDLVEHRDGTRSTYVRDPWGNAIEVLEERGQDT